LRYAGVSTRTARKEGDMNKALHNQITALQVVVAALARSQSLNPEFAKQLNEILISADFATQSEEDQQSVLKSIRLIRNQSE
jgi:hypothetical protein